MESFYIHSGEDEICCLKWIPKGSPRAILQIVPDIYEYTERYKEFAEQLCAMNILVAGCSDYDGKEWNKCLADVQMLHSEMRRTYPSVPYVLLGQGFGSLLLRAYAVQEDTTDLSGLILLGTSGEKIAEDMNGSVEKPLNSFAWLSSDEKVCLAAEKDELISLPLTPEQRGVFLDCLASVSSGEWVNNFPADLPVLVASGWEDPVGLYGQGAAEVADRLTEAGCNVNMVLYEDMCHELLNEKGKEAVYDDLYGYILDMADGVCDVDRAFDCSFE